mmetsp:Transcript_37191/g.77786  ORF Transcript_37191/g.77786 Transcript_37191/m.77786 type:complete len:211 (-) Transcript_37191:717-1349(-)
MRPRVMLLGSRTWLGGSQLLGRQLRARFKAVQPGRRAILARPERCPRPAPSSRLPPTTNRPQTDRQQRQAFCLNRPQRVATNRAVEPSRARRLCFESSAMPMPSPLRSASSRRPSPLSCLSSVATTRQRSGRRARMPKAPVRRGTRQHVLGRAAPGQRDRARKPRITAALLLAEMRIRNNVIGVAVQRSKSMLQSMMSDMVAVPLLRILP